MGRQRQLEAGLDDRRGHGIVAAARAEGRHAALVIASGQPELVARHPRVGDFRFGQVTHAAAPFANAAFAAQNGIAFGLLSDYDRSAVSAYGIAHDDFAGMPGYTVAKRSVFVIDENGQLTFKWVADNPGQEPDYAAVLAAVA